MTFRPNRVAVTVRWALLATMLIGTVICVVNAATDDADRPELQALLERYAATGRVGQTKGRPGAKAPGKKGKTPTDLRVERLARRPMFAPAPRKAGLSAKLEGVLGHLAYFVGNAQGMRVGQSINGAKIKEIGASWIKVDFKGKEMTLQVTGRASKGKAPTRPSKAPARPGRSGPRPTGAKPAPGPTKGPVPAKEPTPPDVPGAQDVPPPGMIRIEALDGHVILNEDIIIDH